MNIFNACLLIASAAVTTRVALAQSSGMTDQNMMSADMKSPSAATTSKAAAHEATGVVRSVDVSGASITLAHESIKSLNWPAMTMGFKVADKALLGKVKPGDRVKFTLAQSGKDYVITSIK